VVALALGEQVPNGGEDGVFFGDDGLDLAAPDDDAFVACAEVAVPGAGLGRLDLVGGLVGAGAESGPGGQPAGVSKRLMSASVSPDDGIGDQDGDAGNRGQEFPGSVKGFHRLVDACGEFVDSAGEGTSPSIASKHSAPTWPR
jgi:hypothetical protein